MINDFSQHWRCHTVQVLVKLCQYVNKSQKGGLLFFTWARSGQGERKRTEIFSLIKLGIAQRSILRLFPKLIMVVCGTVNVHVFVK